MKSDRIASRTWLSNKCVDKRPLYLKLFVFFFFIIELEINQLHTKVRRNVVNDNIIELR